MTKPEAKFIFFRSYPDSEAAAIALISSMQSLDSVLLLIALSRYPHALSTCAMAIEYAIRSSRIGATSGRRDSFEELLNAASRESAEIAKFPREQLQEFRQARNRITHNGFSPQDNREAVRLLIEVGFPFLALCFQQLYSFDLWDAVIQEFVHQWRIGTSVFQRAKKISGLDPSYCLKGFAHLIRWRLKDNFSAVWEIDQLVKSEEAGTSFDFKYQQRRRLEHLYGATWVFDCPLCYDTEAAVCELDNDELESQVIIPLRMACTNCGFVVGEAQPFLSEALLEDNIAQAKEQILNEFGLL
jgi:hypothetical protein